MEVVMAGPGCFKFFGCVFKDGVGTITDVEGNLDVTKVVSYSWNNTQKHKHIKITIVMILIRTLPTPQGILMSWWIYLSHFSWNLVFDFGITTVARLNVVINWACPKTPQINLVPIFYQNYEKKNWIFYFEWKFHINMTNRGYTCTRY
jgi:hypothetical protein